MSSTDSINHQQVAEDVANAASQYAQYELEYQSRLAQQKLLQALHKQNSETAGGEILGLGAPISYEVLNKAVNSKVGQEVIKRGKQFYNDYEEVGWDGAKQRLYSSVQKDLMSKAQELQAQGQQKLVDVKAQAEARVNGFKNDLEAKANDLKEQGQQKLNDLQDGVQQRVNEAQQKAQDMQETAQNKLSDIQNNAQDRVNNFQNDAQERVATLQDNLESQAQNFSDRVAQGEQELNRGVDSIQTAPEEMGSRVSFPAEGDLNQMVNGMFDYFKSRQPMNVTTETLDPEAELGGDLMEGVGNREVYSSLNINPAEMLQSRVAPIASEATDSLQDSLFPLRSLMSGAQQQVSALGNQASSLTRQATQPLNNRQLGSASEEITPADDNIVRAATTDDNIAPKAALDGVEPAAATTEGADAAIGTGAAAATGEAAGEAVPGLLDTIGLALDTNPVTELVGGIIGVGGLIASIVTGFKDLFHHDDDDKPIQPPLQGLYAEQLGGH